jgi:hypothetical protein
LILKGTSEEIPISKSYEECVDRDEYLGFQPDIDKVISTLKNEE